MTMSTEQMTQELFDREKIRDSELRHRGYAVGRSPPRVSPREGGNFRPRWALLTAAPRSKVACSSPNESLAWRPAST